MYTTNLIKDIQMRQTAGLPRKDRPYTAGVKKPAFSRKGVSLKAQHASLGIQHFRTLLKPIYSHVQNSMFK